jgi:hypothetical protein
MFVDSWHFPYVVAAFPCKIKNNYGYFKPSRDFFLNGRCPDNRFLMHVAPKLISKNNSFILSSFPD